MVDTVSQMTYARSKTPRLGSPQQQAEEALMEAQAAAQELSNDFARAQIRLASSFVHRLELIRADLRMRTAQLSGIEVAS